MFIQWDLLYLTDGVSFWEEKKKSLFYSFRELDPAPNPPHFPSHVIQATLDYISNCHKSKSKSLVAVLSKSPVSI